MFGKPKELKFLLAEFPHYRNSAHSTSIGVWAPSNLEVLHRIFKKIKLKPHQRFLDAGSGDGRVVFLASLFCREVVGIEADPVLHFISARRLEQYPDFKNRVRIIRDDYMSHDFSKYDIIFNYADGEVTDEMREKCANEMRPGAKAVFYIYSPLLPGTKMLDKKTPVWLFEK